MRPLRPRFVRLLALGLLGLFACRLAADTPASVAAGRKTAEFSGLIIEYPVGDETFAREFALEYSRLPPGPSAPDDLPALSTLKARRTEFLAAIARELHLRAPTPRMRTVYDQFFQLYSTVKEGQSALQASARHIQIWRGSDLRARLVAGDRIPGIALKPDGSGATFETPATVEAFSTWLFPVMITSRDPETGPALARKKALELQHDLAALTKAWPSSSGLQVILHETVESGILENYLHSADRRWFCEGVANYTAYKVTADLLGPADALRVYDLNAQLAQCASLRATARLEQWAALETQQKQNHDDRSTAQGRANYVFATEVIFKAAAANGPDFLPKLFAEIGRTPSSKASLKTVYRAYEKIFRRDLRLLLPDRS